MNLLLLSPADYDAGSRSTVRLRGRRFEHARSVCKIEVGETLRVGDINGAMGTGLVTALTGDTLEMRVTLTDPPPPPLPLTLVLALPRPKALKRCIEAVTAMGVKRIIIIESWRVEKSYWSSPVLAENVLREHALLGLEQGGDTVLPRIELRRRFKPFVEDELPTLSRGTRPFVAHPYADSPCPCDLTVPVTLALGPEGGFIPYEIDLFKNAGFEPVSLGRRILRVEYALPAVIGRLCRT